MWTIRQVREPMQMHPVLPESVPVTSQARRMTAPVTATPNPLFRIPRMP